MPPKVSINLCCYNSERFLQDTLKSIEDQTFNDWELVIINDGSSDSTESIIMQFKDRGFPVLYHFQENRGLGYSRNKALELSTGEYIAFIDHDDMWLPEKLERQMAAFLNNPDADFVYSNLFVLENGQRRVNFNKRQPDGYVFDKFLHHYPVAVLTVMVRKEALQGLDGFFDRKLHLAEEYDLFMRLLCKSKAVFIDDPLAVYRVHPDMSSIKFFGKWPDEMTYVIEKLKHADSSLEKKYDYEFGYMNAKIGYYRARAEMYKSNRLKAREHLNPYKWTDYKFFFLYLMTYFPPGVWRKVHANRDGGTFGGPG